MTEQQTGQESGEQQTEGQQEQGQQQDQQQEQRQEQQTEGKIFSEDYVKSLRTESAGYRTRAQKAESRVKELESGQGADLTTAQTERDNLANENQQLRERIRRAAFIETIGLPSPRLAYASLSDLSMEVEYDEEDRPKNLEKIRKALKEEFPREFGDGSADGGSRTNGSGGYDGTPGVGRLRHAYGQKE